jgi:hypothetical protein
MEDTSIPQKLSVHTDGEPDDFLGIFQLFLKKHEIPFIYVGRNKQDNLTPKLTEQFNIFFDCCVKDGVISKIPIIITSPEELVTILNEVDGIVSLRPPTELIHLINTDNKKLLERFKIYFYGSFNFRDVEDNEAIIKLLNIPISSICFESFITFEENNSLDIDKYEEFKYVFSTIYPSVYDFLIKNINEWNKSIYDKQLLKLKTLINKALNLEGIIDKHANEEQYDTAIDIFRIKQFDKDLSALQRSKKIITNIRLAPLQIIAADFGLTTCMGESDIDLNNVYVGFNTIGYTKYLSTPFDGSTKNKCYVYGKTSLDYIVLKMLTNMKKFMKFIK